MLKVWDQPLRRQLLIALLLLLVPVFGAAIWFGLATYRDRVDEFVDQTQVLAVRVADAIERELTGFDGLARNLSTNPSIQGLDREAAVPLLQPQRLQRSSLVELVLVDREGQLVARGAGSSEITGGWKELAAPVLASGTRVVSGMQMSPSGTPFVCVGYPVRDASDEIVAVLGLYLDTELLQDQLALLSLPPGSVVTLTEADGRVLARNLEPERFVGTTLQGRPPGMPARLGRERDGIDGVRRMYSEATVMGGRWIVRAGIPMSVAFDHAMSLWSRSAAVLALGLIGWLLVALVFSRRLTHSLGHLDTAAQRIASGDFRPLERQPMPTREFQELQEAFDQMVRRFNETRAALDAQMAEERRIREELESLQGQVIRQERLAAVGQLVSGVAHEINNPLQAILGFSELLQMQGDVPKSIKGDLQLIQKESARACGIIRNLAMFARQHTGDAAPIRLIDVIKSVSELRQRRLESEGIELRVEDTSAHYVLAVLTELQQVVLNFVVNAEQAIVNSGRQPARITVRTRDDRDRVILEVEDTGPGVRREHESRLFQPFFTTKPVGQGTGLGLSVSYGIIDSLRGHIGYRTAPAGGAIFYFDLPAVSAAGV